MKIDFTTPKTRMQHSYNSHAAKPHPGYAIVINGVAVARYHYYETALEKSKGIGIVVPWTKLKAHGYKVAKKQSIEDVRDAHTPDSLIKPRQFTIAEYR